MAVVATVDAMIVAGGDRPSSRALAIVPRPSLVVAADSGADHLLAADIRPDLIVGDLDSISSRSLDRARALGVAIEEHPVDKDKTDLELALDVVTERGAGTVVVLGVAGDRLDHELANLLVIGQERYRSLTITAVAGRTIITVVRGRRDLAGVVDSTVTLLPVLGDATDVTTEGLVYPLHGETLTAGSSRGVSNRLARPRASVTVGGGVVLALQPDALAS